jgi:hypothetical protein
VALVRRYVRDHPGTDVVAVMAAYNPVFERAGMSRTTDSHVPAPKGLLAAMRGVGMDASRWHERAYCTSLMASEDARRALADFASHATNLVCPGGKRPPVDEIAKHIANDQATAGRVLWGLRERRLAKFVHKENP